MGSGIGYSAVVAVKGVIEQGRIGDGQHEEVVGMTYLRCHRGSYDVVARSGDDGEGRRFWLKLSKVWY